MRNCEFCNREVSPSSPNLWHRVIGWERKGQQGGSDIVLRERRDVYACEPCIVLQRSDRVGQESLI